MTKKATGSMPKYWVFYFFIAVAGIFAADAMSCGFNWSAKGKGGKAKKADNPLNIVFVEDEELELKIKRLGKALNSSGHNVSSQALNEIDSAEDKPTLILSAPASLEAVEGKVGANQRVIVLHNSVSDADSQKTNDKVLGSVALSDYTINQVKKIESIGSELSQ